MGWLLSDEERDALWRDEEKPTGVWECAEVRAKRYEDALRGILACSGGGIGVWMLQAVAATALRENDLAEELMERIRDTESQWRL
jgi:hypothetical protein